MKKQSRRTSAPESAKTEKTGGKKKQTDGKQVKKKAAQYAGMPSSAIATILVDYILTPAAMLQKLMAYVSGPYLSELAAKFRTVFADPMQKNFVLLRNRTGHDFSSYKSSMICRIRLPWWNAEILQSTGQQSMRHSSSNIIGTENHKAIQLLKRI